MVCPARLKSDGLIKRAALRAPGTIDIGVIGVNKAAFFTAKDSVFAGGGPKPAAAKLGI
jgi:hypothetical protein